jgi:hypothetical protein
LNTPEFYGDRSADGGRDALQPSSNLDYLLEDEDEEKPSRGLGKLILIVAALALMVGFGYFHWKQGGFDWLDAGDKKATAVKPTAGAAPTGADSGNATAANPEGAAAGTVGAGTAPATGAANPADSGAGQVTPSQRASQGAASDTASPAAASQSVPQQSVAQKSAAPETQLLDPNLPANSGSQAAGSDSGGASAAAGIPETRARKPAAAKAVTSKPVDLVTEAERYIYGRGVRQNCDHGLRMLKPAATRSNPKAMISLGALYATGTCTPRDLPSAYRWFALALHQEPDNQALQDDLQKLWSQMTQPERQLAIKLSQ